MVSSAPASPSTGLPPWTQAVRPASSCRSNQPDGARASSARSGRAMVRSSGMSSPPAASPISEISKYVPRPPSATPVTVTRTCSVGPGGRATVVSSSARGYTVVVPVSVRTSSAVTCGPTAGAGTVSRRTARSTGSGRSMAIHSPKAEPYPPERQAVSGSPSTAAATECEGRTGPVWAESAAEDDTLTRASHQRARVRGGSSPETLAE